MKGDGAGAGLLILLPQKGAQGPARRSRNQSSADWQSAVSRIGNPLVPSNANACPTASRGIRQVANLRYDPALHRRKIFPKNKDFELWHCKDFPSVPSVLFCG
ncbi:MAG TPA: hypothetical protein VJT54_00170 [Verrucomicrobiae bacterium]|nr:hypothetical protein [Verrucomicrobiae bacterium]